MAGFTLKPGHLRVNQGSFILTVVDPFLNRCSSLNIQDLLFTLLGSIWKAHVYTCMTNKGWNRHKSHLKGFIKPKRSKLKLVVNKDENVIILMTWA